MTEKFNTDKINVRQINNKFSNKYSNTVIIVTIFHISEVFVLQGRYAA